MSRFIAEMNGTELYHSKSANGYAFVVRFRSGAKSCYTISFDRNKIANSRESFELLNSARETYRWVEAILNSLRTAKGQIDDRISA
ncbi:hypothetical protein ONR75_18595 [Rhodopseudomonas sp. P2A-2r]|uniref:hypothetical protein n=1 Tax=Rhodopseudomonas sp. P2A-2r TaxID=2991972 RepID=UPI00223419EC|nr:hypothetical protein [Rhodopseudomonas sp. P2A-2r]UZE47014.1 hypothetical protein ONR75_18595 [Rhodopseudomonas sp. P2A-2r]